MLALTRLTLLWLLSLGVPPVLAEQAAPFAPGLYAFQNGLKFKSAEEGIRIIKDLGYRGVGSVEPEDLAKFKVICEREGLEIFSVYLGGIVNAESFSYGKEVAEAIELLKGTGAPLELNVQRGNAPSDAQAVAMVAEIANMAKNAGLKLVIYPHSNFHIERVDHALKIARATGCDNVGVAFNLCHFLKVQPGDDLSATLAEAAPLLWSVSICGADTDGKDWTTLIRPLDEGTFALSLLIRKLRAARYPNAVGLQCFNIRINAKENLTRSMRAWKNCLSEIQAD